MLVNELIVELHRCAERHTGPYDEAFERGNRLLAAFINGRVSRSSFDLEQLARGRHSSRRGFVAGGLFDHHVYVRRGSTPLAIFTFPYNYEDEAFLRRGEVVARQLTAPSWYASGTQAFLVMHQNAEAWHALAPMLRPLPAVALVGAIDVE